MMVKMTEIRNDKFDYDLLALHYINNFVCLLKTCIDAVGIPNVKLVMMNRIRFTINQINGICIACYWKNVRYKAVFIR